MTPTRLQSRRALALVPAGWGIAVALLLTLIPGPADMDGTTLGFVVWNLIPHAALVIIVLETSAHAPQTWPALAVGVGANAVVTAVALGSFLFDEGSTGALVFLFLPAYLIALVVATAIAAGITYAVRSPRPRPVRAPQ